MNEPNSEVLARSPLLDPRPGDRLTLADLDALFDVPFVFWVCPKGCRGQVQWNADCTDATCLVCGCRRHDARPAAGEITG